MKTRKSSNFKTKRLKYLKLRKKGGESMWTKTKRFGNKVKLKLQIMNVNKDIFFIKKKIDIMTFNVTLILNMIDKNIENFVMWDNTFNNSMTNYLKNIPDLASTLSDAIIAKYKLKLDLEENDDKKDIINKKIDHFKQHNDVIISSSTSLLKQIDEHNKTQTFYGIHNINDIIPKKKS